MTKNQARTLLLVAAVRAQRTSNFERLQYLAVTAAMFTQVEKDAKALRGRFVKLGADTSTELSLLGAAGRAGEVLDFDRLAEVAETVVRRDQLAKLRYDLQCRLAYLASVYGTPTREARKPTRKGSKGPTRARRLR